MSVEVRNIHKIFGPVHANNNISLSLEDGRIYGVLGENGAGKSTLMKILSGFYLPDDGQILVDGKQVFYDNPQGAILAGFGMLAQDPLDVGPFTVLENFVYGMPGGTRPDWDAARQKFLEIAAHLGFELDLNTTIERLSIGQRQELEIIRLLALGVRVLILDEPTTGISAEQKEVLFSSLKRLAKDDGLTVLFVSHKLEDVLDLCDEVAVLRLGKLVGTAQLPVTTNELVAMMFGQELAPATRVDVMLGDTVLEVQDLYMISERVTLSKCHLKLRAGEVVGLAGLDGSGQQLLTRACVGLEKPLGGRVLIKGADLTGRNYRDFMDAQVSFGSAGRLEEGLVSGLTLTEHFILTDHEQKWWINRERGRRLTEEQIRHYHVYGRPDSPIETLSGGNQQRVLMALMPAAPHVLVLEHPTRGLDVESARWIWEQLLARRKTGTAVLFTSADLEEIVTYSDRILVFYAGQVTEIPDAKATTVEELGHLIGGQNIHEGAAV
ncbi:MAG: ATP-binding cassette domain-containing protein [Anaerolineae bacterium]|nr:ATP-binding cassette domain-containing protein [Anaerolineae bacterium]